MPYQPVDYGNALLKAEQINALRVQNDPNSLKNQLLQAKILDLTNPGSSLEYGKVNPGSFTPSSLSKFEAAGGGPENFGLLENYAAPQIIDLGGVPHRVSRSGTGELQITKIPLSTLEAEMGGQGAKAYAGEAGKQFAQSGRANPYAPVQPGDINLNVGQAQLAPPSAGSLAASKTTATEQAKADVKEKVQKKANSKAYATFEIGLSNLEQSMKNTLTAPGMDLIPAVTANQQIAEGAKATMAPILKQLFRAAGEGIFTDKDQALLMEMLPTRNDHPEAVNAKLNNINVIVRSKLQMDMGEPSTTGESYEQRKARILGQ